MMKQTLRERVLYSTASRRWTILSCFAGITLALCPLPCLAQSPTITSVSTISAEQYQTIVIKGSGFGTQAPYTGDSDYISLEDQTANPGWQAGYAPYNDTVTLIVTSWQNDKIVLGGFSGGWGEYNYILTVGDSEQVEVWNAQSGEGPSTVYVTVGTEPTTTTLTSSPNPSNAGEKVTFTATVNSSSGPPPDGETVSFMQGTIVGGKATLKGGTATVTTSKLGAGSHSVTAVYGGDSNFSESKSKVVKQVVN
jgi:hypothetical protein